MVDADGGHYSRVRIVTIGFSAVPDLVAKKVDAATAFWNAEGVTLKQRGVPVRVFRADDFGAPHYPELVIATKRSLLRREPDLIRRALAALGDGSNAARSDPSVALQPIVQASGADPSLIRAELAAVRPILAPGVALNFSAIRAWAAFDARFGILKRAPNARALFVSPR
jgi:NitT/TauT family transport system substrate-binding protein/putative hydroxymethylpyrimidine transport system substrate-binding protein